MFMRVQLAGAVPLAIFVFVLDSSAALHADAAASFDLLALVRLGVDPSWQPLLLGLIARHRCGPRYLTAGPIQPRLASHLC